jgi:hypothetical protein
MKITDQIAHSKDDEELKIEESVFLSSYIPKSLDEVWNYVFLFRY